ncbi:MAG: hypothetical protein GX493_12165 [Firmicutes bacterium]|nr:hypothetical protein [Bacillota bacterium]
MEGFAIMLEELNRKLDLVLLLAERAAGVTVDLAEAKDLRSNTRGGIIKAVTRGTRRGAFQLRGPGGPSELTAFKRLVPGGPFCLPTGRKERE